MFDLEVVCVAPHNTGNVHRQTGRYDSVEFARMAADQVVRKVADEDVVLVHELAYHDSVIYTDGHVAVGYANITEVVGE